MTRILLAAFLVVGLATPALAGGHEGFFGFGGDKRRMAFDLARAAEQVCDPAREAFRSSGADCQDQQEQRLNRCLVDCGEDQDCSGGCYPEANGHLQKCVNDAWGAAAAYCPD